MSDDHDEHLAIHKQFMNLSLPNEYLTSVYDGLTQHVNEHFNILKYGTEWARKSHTVKHSVEDLTAKQAERDEFLTRWRALNEEGEAKGWLEDYGDGLFPVELPEFTYETVYDETEEEWEARKATLPETVTFRVISDRNVPPGESFIVPDDLS